MMYSAPLTVPGEFLLNTNSDLDIKSLKKLLLKQFLAHHPGTSRMKTLARHDIYWSGLGKDIDSLVQACSKCAKDSKLSIEASVLFSGFDIIAVVVADIKPIWS
ncbi:Hypothetical predicted protein [Octopus vulgaris]|uniref:Integrase zinc-binding domain-containing protein n=1 Tax=Octopus vulgaris TaxID=6645 RepID=A0AA36BAZ0_OCTVU|nr:Hypothetical predicted protein [Octopus vulgaris]